MITDRIGRHEVLLPINHNNSDKRGRKLFRIALKLRLVDLNYNIECDWLIELSDNNLASELVENRSFLNQSGSRKL